MLVLHAHEAKIVAALEQRGLNFAPLEPKEMKELLGWPNRTAGVSHGRKLRHMAGHERPHLQVTEINRDYWWGSVMLHVVASYDWRSW